MIHLPEQEGSVILDLMDTSSLSVEDIKIKKEQEMANCYGFDVRILMQTCFCGEAEIGIWLAPSKQMNKAST